MISFIKRLHDRKSKSSVNSPSVTPKSSTSKDDLYSKPLPPITLEMRKSSTSSATMPAAPATFSEKSSKANTNNSQEDFVFPLPSKNSNSKKGSLLNRPYLGKLPASVSHTDLSQYARQKEFNLNTVSPYIEEGSSGSRLDSKPRRTNTLSNSNNGLKGIVGLGIRRRTGDRSVRRHSSWYISFSSHTPFDEGLNQEQVRKDGFENYWDSLNQKDNSSSFESHSSDKSRFDALKPHMNNLEKRHGLLIPNFHSEFCIDNETNVNNQQYQHSIETTNTLSLGQTKSTDASFGTDPKSQQLQFGEEPEHSNHMPDYINNNKDNCFDNETTSTIKSEICQNPETNASENSIVDNAFKVRKPETFRNKNKNKLTINTKTAVEKMPVEDITIIFNNNEAISTSKRPEIQSDFSDLESIVDYSPEIAAASSVVMAQPTLVYAKPRASRTKNCTSLICNGNSLDTEKKSRRSSISFGDKSLLMSPIVDGDENNGDDSLVPFANGRARVTSSVSVSDFRHCLSMPKPLENSLTLTTNNNNNSNSKSIPPIKSMIIASPKSSCSSKIEDKNSNNAKTTCIQNTPTLNTCPVPPAIATSPEKPSKTSKLRKSVSTASRLNSTFRSQREIIQSWRKRRSGSSTSSIVISEPIDVLHLSTDPQYAKFQPPEIQQHQNNNNSTGLRRSIRPEVRNNRPLSFRNTLSLSNMSLFHINSKFSPERAKQSQNRTIISGASTLRNMNTLLETLEEGSSSVFESRPALNMSNASVPSLPYAIPKPVTTNTSAKNATQKNRPVIRVITSIPDLSKRSTSPNKVKKQISSPVLYYSPQPASNSSAFSSPVKATEQHQQTPASSQAPLANALQHSPSLSSDDDVYHSDASRQSLSWTSTGSSSPSNFSAATPGDEEMANGHPMFPEDSLSPATPFQDEEDAEQHQPLLMLSTGENIPLETPVERYNKGTRLSMISSLSTPTSATTIKPRMQPRRQVNSTVSMFSRNSAASYSDLLEFKDPKMSASVIPRYVIDSVKTTEMVQADQPILCKSYGERDRRLDSVRETCQRARQKFINVQTPITPGGIFWDEDEDGTVGKSTSNVLYFSV